MGTELQAKYSRLTQEYAKVRAQVDVLKKAIRDEKSQKSAIEESLRERSLNLRKHVQENESLEFRNQQLSKRVSLLQEEIASPNKKKKKGQDGFAIAGVSEIHAQELAAKISENGKLHMKVLELTQKSERSIRDLQLKVGKLEAEAAGHQAGVEELEREHKTQVDNLTERKTLMEVKMMQQVEQMGEMRSNLDRLQAAASEWRQKTLSGKGSREPKLSRGNMLMEGEASYSYLNVPVVDTKLQAEVLTALRSGLELVTTFTTQISTCHSYLEQRCKCYPVDVSTGLHMSTINTKLCTLLHSSSSYTRPLAKSFSSYCDKLEMNPFSQNVAGDFGDFARNHKRFVSYMETLTPYLKLSLQEESNESVCGPSLTEHNMQLSKTFPLFTAAFRSIDDYISVIITGQSENIPVTSVRFCLEKLNASLRHLQDTINELSSLFSSKVTLEYQLPTASQKINTTNECVISALNGIHSTAKQLSGYLESNCEVFGAAMEQNAARQTDSQSSDQSTVVQNLRVRATNYLRKLRKDCPPSVPYTLAVFHSRSLSSSTENNQTLMKQVTASKEKLSRLEQDREQLVVDLQLLSIKYEKEQKKTASLEAELSHLRQVGMSSLSASSAVPAIMNSTSPSPAPSDSNLHINDSLGSVSFLSSEEEESIDDTTMIRKFFVDRITVLNNQIQESDSKSAHYYAECRALHKQLGHNTVLRNKQTQELQAASESIQQLQDQLMTTCSNYEKQLSTMSDHLCELNDKMLQKSEELDQLRKPTKARKKGK